MADQLKRKNRETNNEEMTDDLPQEITESYGTGVHPEPGANIGTRRLRDEMKQYTSTGPELTGGDVDAAWEQAEAVGEEAVGGTVATPDQSVVDDLGVAVGLEMSDRTSLHTNDILTGRDSARWELEPESSEDFSVRNDEED